MAVFGLQAGVPLRWYTGIRKWIFSSASEEGIQRTQECDPSCLEDPIILSPTSSLRFLYVPSPSKCPSAENGAADPHSADPGSAPFLPCDLCDVTGWLSVWIKR